MSCAVCLREPNRPMLHFVNGYGRELFIHHHHRVTTVFKAGFDIRLEKLSKRPSKKVFIWEKQLA